MLEGALMLIYFIFLSNGFLLRQCLYCLILIYESVFNLIGAHNLLVYIKIIMINRNNFKHAPSTFKIYHSPFIASQQSYRHFKTIQQTPTYSVRGFGVLGAQLPTP